MARQKDRFSIRERKNSFKAAFAGLAGLWREEHNFRIHLLAALLAIILGFVFNISRGEWLMIILAIALVMVTEALNSALEKLCDWVHEDEHPRIKKIKDYGAAAVLLASMAALAIGLLIFIPRLAELFTHSYK